MARPERFELPTTKFVAWYSIQLSYGREESRIIPLRRHRVNPLHERKPARSRLSVDGFSPGVSCCRGRDDRAFPRESTRPHSDPTPPARLAAPDDRDVRSNATTAPAPLSASSAAPVPTCAASPISCALPPTDVPATSKPAAADSAAPGWTAYSAKDDKHDANYWIGSGI